MWRYRGFRVAAFLAETLPRPLAYLFAFVVAEVGFLLNREGRRVAESNMRQVIGPHATRRRIRRAARGCFRAAAMYYTDLARTPKMNPERFFRSNLDVTGFEHLAASAASGRGCIAVSIHYGNPEYAAQSLGAMGIRFMALVEPLDSPEMSALTQRYRLSQGHEFVEVGMRGTRQAIRHVRRGGTLAVLVDRDIQHNGAIVSFLGRPARIPTGAVELAMATGADLIPFFTRRIGLDRFEATLHPPLELVRTGNTAADARTNMEALLEIFEQHLRRDPSQWFVLEEPVWQAAGAADEAACKERPKRQREMRQ
ncbi:MAG: lysophospholipid acyltransferase family protein [Chloroflexi bacterium]|nr:lysophospholipid acyltransferase family protein [Chloroflexota bacterium]